MFGQFTDTSNRGDYAAIIEKERREKLKEKMRRDIDLINSSGSSHESDETTTTTDSDDSVEKLRKLKDRKRENAKLRRERRLKREKKLRDKMKKLDKLEKNLRNGGSPGAAAGGGGLPIEALASLGGGVSPGGMHSIDAVAHVLRALGGKKPAETGTKEDGTPRQPEPLLPNPAAFGGAGAFASAAAAAKGNAKRGDDLTSSSSSNSSDEERKDQAKDKAQNPKVGGLDLRNKFQRAVNKAMLGNRIMDEVQTIRQEKKVLSNIGRRRSAVRLDMNDSGMAQIGDLVSSINRKVDEEEQRKKMSGLAKFLSNDLTKVHHDDFDSGVNAMALLCALVLSVPYQVAGPLDYSNLDWMKGQIDVCTNEWTYGFVYTGYRASFVITVYFSIGGMIMSTFYFLFKRNDDFDYKIWRSKARYMVILIFFCTALAIIGLVLLTNLYFDYFLLSSTENICSNGTTPYFVTGCGVSIAAFVGAFWLIL